jgi:hypothetical protein
MEFKGTKDDWIADYSHESETYISCNGLRIAEVKHYKSDDLNDPSTEEGRANAKLMVASPKLLKALKETDKDLCVLWGQVKHLEDSNPIAEGLSDLIQKWRDRNKEAINEALN